jgi:hypothetical protein
VLSVASSISCQIRGRGYFGYLHWDGGNAKMAYMDDVPRHATSSFTSGWRPAATRRSSPGITVGKIIHVYNSPDGVSYRLQVALSTDFGKLRDVCVIDNKPCSNKWRCSEPQKTRSKPKTPNRNSYEYRLAVTAVALYHIAAGTGLGVEPHTPLRLCHAPAYIYFVRQLQAQLPQMGHPAVELHHGPEC